MNIYSRRDVLSSLAITSASLLTNGKHGELVPAETELSESVQVVPPDHREAADKLLKYFSDIAPGLLRNPEGILQHPWISISLPQKQYSGSSWDWDTLFISRGLLRFANMSGDRALHEKVCSPCQG